MLYARYVGINGSLFDFKVLGLQLMTVLLQVGGDMRALCVCVLEFLCVYELAGLIRLRLPLSFFAFCLFHERNLLSYL